MKVSFDVGDLTGDTADQLLFIPTICNNNGLTLQKTPSVAPLKTISISNN
ncbi:hypothetical protein QGM71_14860 [Virgibacillus sp. C22-A2]|uniref:Uncharacterized protein n=1 Tax=Virgibacillus tibetensis TaxID=3042313 RepID=A0ABU6KHT0_9BACI|nr:hypothetical protein [Virgibacillus sp. C22-A2]